jgi:hypothetical protein
MRDLNQETDVSGGRVFVEDGFGQDMGEYDTNLER